MIVKGQKINDRYQIVKSIGEGGMANVYLAFDTILDRNVAVKVLRGDLATDEKFVRRFQREALSSSSLTHPNIVEVYDVGEDDGVYYIVMEYIEGKLLKNLLKKRVKLTTTEAVDIMLQISDGLSVAHDSYIIHRDIKPQNIMILDNGMIKITDFGIAMAMNSTQLTQTNSVMGSVHYLPPEQANGKGSTLKSDIYSMGILMYELLTGKLPFRGDNAVEIALKHLKEPFPNIKDILPEVPQSIVNIIMKATAKNPDNRYKDAREMNEDLSTCLNENRVDEKPYKFNNSEDEVVKKEIKPVKESKKLVDKDKEVIATQITDEDLKKQNKVLLILAGIFASLIVCITAVVLLLPLFTNEDEIKIPDVTNMTVKKAISELQDAGFEIADEQREESSEDVAEGDIIKTNPPVGTKRAKGTEVILYISIGDSESYEIEDYVGKNYLEVKGALEVHGLYVIVEKMDIDESNADKYDDQEIVKQSVKKGENLSKGDTITLYIPNVIIKYPDFTDGDWKVKDIEEFCDKYGVKLNVDYVETTSEEEGIILKQNRAAGKYIVTEGGSLTIEVAKEPQNNTTDEENCEQSGLC